MRNSGKRQGLNVPPNPNVEALPHNRTGGDAVYMRSWGGGMMGVQPSQEIEALFLSAERTVRRLLPASREESPRREPDLPAPGPGAPQPPGPGEIKVCCGEPTGVWDCVPAAQSE